MTLQSSPDDDVAIGVACHCVHDACLYTVGGQSGVWERQGSGLSGRLQGR